MVAAEKKSLSAADSAAVQGQSEVIAFLSAGASYGLPGCDVERIETHCSEIFLVADRAYKLKRALAFSVLDYRTAERREAACRAEVALNRRTAPELYLGVRAIQQRENGGLGFDGGGPALDWVVEMWRFDQADLFDRLADTELLTDALMLDLADEIAGFHATADRLTGFGGAGGLAQAMAQNSDDFATLGPVLDPEAVRAVQEKSAATLQGLGSLLDRRASAGKVRRCHGDLRLANICLIDGRPTLFDGIEFSESLSCIDVLYDLSFLLMDLGNLRLMRFANIVLNRYLDQTGESDGLATLPLMISLRSATRAFGLACGAERRRARPGEARHFAESAGRHLAFAGAMLEKSPVRLMALGGLSSGTKSALAYGLAAAVPPAPGARVVKAEVALRRVLGLAADARIPASSRMGELAASVQGALAQEAAAALGAGRSAIVEAPLMRRSERQTLRALAAAADVPFVGLWLGPAHTLDEDERGQWRVLERGGDFSALFAHARALIEPACHPGLLLS